MSVNMLVICSNLLKFFLSEINTPKKYLKTQHEEGKELQ